jgi:hypothetical protein
VGWVHSWPQFLCPFLNPCLVPWNPAVPPWSDSKSSHVTCFGQWQASIGDLYWGLWSACTTGSPAFRPLPLPNEHTWVTLLEDERCGPEASGHTYPGQYRPANPRHVTKPSQDQNISTDLQACEWKSHLLFEAMALGRCGISEIGSGSKRSSGSPGLQEQNPREPWVHRPHFSRTLEIAMIKKGRSLARETQMLLAHGEGIQLQYDSAQLNKYKSRP